MKKTGCVLAGILLGTGAAMAQVTQTLNISKDNRTLTVTASGSAYALADVAVVHIGYQDYGNDEAESYSNGSRRSNAVVAALLAAGVQEDAIESQDQSLQPLSEYEVKNLPSADKAKRFRITQSWDVRTMPDRAARILDVAVKAGANQSGNIGWELKDDSALEGEASAKALVQAQRKATQMAEGLHVHVGLLLYASNEAQPVVMMRSMALRAPAMVADKASSKPLAIATRRVERSSTVFAIFALE